MQMKLKVAYTTLPDPLVLKMEQRLPPAVWWKNRPEIVADFEKKWSGVVPKNTPKVNWEVTSTTGYCVVVTLPLQKFDWAC